MGAYEFERFSCGGGGREERRGQYTDERKANETRTKQKKHTERERERETIFHPIHPNPVLCCAMATRW